MSERVVHCKRAPHDVYIGRGSEWGNPFTHLELAAREITTCGIRVQMSRVGSREEAIEKFRAFLWARVRAKDVSVTQLAALHGQTLGCWCAPRACHGDVLVAAADWARRELEGRETAAS